jgi:pilus assembly protein Flp/PilA
MMNRMNAMIRSEQGQGMTEYIIIVALIAIAAIGVITVFGQNIRALFAVSANALGGNTSQQTTAAGGAGANFAAAKKRTLGNFNATNDGKN